MTEPREFTDTERLETANAIACDRAYIEGCRVGYRLGLYEDREGRDAVVASRSKDIHEARAVMREVREFSADEMFEWMITVEANIIGHEMFYTSKLGNRKRAEANTAQEIRDAIDAAMREE